MQAPRRRRFAIDRRADDDRAGTGELAAIEFGPTDRPVDLLFLHANGFNAMTYRHLLAPLGNSWRVLAIDQRGHGRSTLAADIEGRRNWMVFADDFAALLATFTTPVIFAGHSMGATAGLLALPKAAAALRALVLLEPVLRPPGPVEVWDSPLARGARHRRADFADRAEALANYRGRGAFATWPEPVIADYLIDGLADRPDGGLTLACTPQWEAANFALHDHDPWAAFTRPHPPIRILRAGRGSTCRIDGREEHLTGVDITIIPDSTHFLPLEHPDVARQALVQALTVQPATPHPI